MEAEILSQNVVDGGVWSGDFSGFSRYSRGGSFFEEVAGELSLLRRRSRQLAELNRLYSSLASVSEVDALIETLGRWLGRIVAEEMPLCAEVVTRTGCRRGQCRAVAGRWMAVEEYAEEFALLAGRESGLRTGKVGGRGCWGGRFPFVVDGGEWLLLVLCRTGRLRRSEVRLVEAALTAFAGSLERALACERLYLEARNDLLTGLGNRRAFDEYGGRMIAAARRSGRPVSMVLMDLDNFKQVNDNLGHLCGDKALVQVAEVLRRTVRESDLVVRFGGDEFVALLDGTPLAGACQLAGRLRSAVKQLAIRPAEGVWMTLSVGVCELRQGESIEAWLVRADTLLYAEKQAGRVGRGHLSGQRDRRGRPVL